MNKFILDLFLSVCFNSNVDASTTTRHFNWSRNYPSMNREGWEKDAAEVSGIRGCEFSCEEKIRAYVNELFITRKHIQDEYPCSPPKSDCFHRFFLETSTPDEGDIYFASYERNQGYSTAEIFRVTVQGCEITKVVDDSN